MYCIKNIKGFTVGKSYLYQLQGQFTDFEENIIGNYFINDKYDDYVEIECYGNSIIALKNDNGFVQILSNAQLKRYFCKNKVEAKRKIRSYKLNEILKT